MSHIELGNHGLSGVILTAAQKRAAAVHVADRIAAEHPHPDDELMPRQAGKQLAQDPAINAGVRELLDALGLLPGGRRRTTR